MKKLLCIALCLLPFVANANIEINVMEGIKHCQRLEKNDYRLYCMAFITDDKDYCDMMDEYTSQEFCYDMFKNNKQGK